MVRFALIALTLSCLALGAVQAQSSLSTHFSGGMNAPAGGVHYFDIDVTYDLTITALDVHLDNGNPGTSINVYVRSGSWIGFHVTPGGWLPVSSGTIASPSSGGSASAVTLTTPVPLNAGTHGVLIAYVGDGQAFTDGLFPLYRELESNADLIIYEGGVGNGPFIGLTGAPRQWNGTIYYSLGSAGTASYPGNSDEVRLRTATTAPGTSPTYSTGLGFDVKTLAAGEVLALNIDSPSGSLEFQAPLIGVQVFGTGSAAPSFPGAPFVWLEPGLGAGPIILNDSGPFGVGSLITPTGLELAFAYPGGLAGQSLMLQALVVDNGVLHAGDAHEIQLQ